MKRTQFLRYTYVHMVEYFLRFVLLKKFYRKGRGRAIREVTFHCSYLIKKNVKSSDNVLLRWQEKRIKDEDNKMYLRRPVALSMKSSKDNAPYFEIAHLKDWKLWRDELLFYTKKGWRERLCYLKYIFFYFFINEKNI